MQWWSVLTDDRCSEMLQGIMSVFRREPVWGVEGRGHSATSSFFPIRPYIYSDSSCALRDAVLNVHCMNVRMLDGRQNEIHFNWSPVDSRRLNCNCIFWGGWGSLIYRLRSSETSTSALSYSILTSCITLWDDSEDCWDDHQDSTALTAEHRRTQSPQERCPQWPHPSPVRTVHTPTHRPKVQECEMQDVQTQECFFPTVTRLLNSWRESIITDSYYAVYCSLFAL